MTRVAVVGAGIIGLAAAWRCALRGHEVTVYDPAPATGASAVAAGMLAPVGETRFGEGLHRLLLFGSDRWGSFAAELAAESGQDVGYQRVGTLIVALTADDVRTLGRLVDFYRRTDLPVEPLSAAEVRQREPMLSTRVRAGAFVAIDRQVDPRRVIRALRTVLDRRGVTLVRGAAEPAGPRTETEPFRAAGADVTVLAAGHATAALAPEVPVRPVKGQIIRLRTSEPRIRHVIRGYVANRPVYVVPRADGEVVIGATEEERGADTTVTAGGMLDLLRPAVDLVPGITEYALVEMRAALRPGTPDNGPVVGRLGPATLVATGHYRDGVLLAPVTADAVAGLVAGGALPAEFTPFQPQRFGHQPGNGAILSRGDA